MRERTSEQRRERGREGERERGRVGKQCKKRNKQVYRSRVRMYKD